MSDAAQVHDDGLDSVTLSLNLGLDALHLVAVEGVGDITTNVDSSHDCCGFVKKVLGLMFNGEAGDQRRS